MKYSFLVLMLLTFRICMCQTEMVKSIFFKPGSYKVDEKYMEDIISIAAKCRSDSFVGIRFYGYSDTIGSDDYNFNLSKLRIEAVENTLAKFVQIDSSRKQYIILGESDDGYDLHFKQSHLMQRCVDIRIRFFKKNVSFKSLKMGSLFLI